MEREAYDRVTAILAPFSGISRVDPEVLSRAAYRGSCVHALCEGIIQGIDVTVPQEYKGYIDSFLYWYEGKEFLNNPGRMYDDELQITGEADGLFMDNGLPTIFDLKTSVQESCTWKYQGAAYIKLINQRINGVCHFIRLSKEGKKPKVHQYQYVDNIETFLKCVDLYRTFYKTKLPINEDYL